MPHKPLACSEDFYKKSGAGLYGDALAELDWSVGRVLDTLKELGLDDRTLVRLHQRQRPVVRGQHRRPAGDEGDDLGGGLPRSPASPAGPAGFPRAR